MTRRLASLFFTASILALSSFLPVENSILDTSNLQMRAVAPKRAPRKAWKDVFKIQIETGNYRALGYMIKKALKDGVSLSKLQKYAVELECEPLQQALEAGSRMLQLRPKIGLRLHDCIQLALYIETDFKEEIKEHGNYRSRRKTGLPRTVEYDPQTDFTFIHLRNDTKMVSSSILYNKTTPELVMHSIRKGYIPSECTAVKELQSLPGLYEVKAITHRETSDGTQFSSVFSKQYPCGTLEQFLRSKTGRKKVSYKDRLRMAYDILTGIESLHERGYVHRDLTLKNCLVYRKDRETSRGKRYSVVISNFSKVIPITEAAGRKAQQSAFYRAPEAINYPLLKGKDYYVTDLYAAGCILHSLILSKPAPWVKMHIIKDTKKPVEERVKKQRDILEQYRNKRCLAMYLKNKYRDNVPITEPVERFVLWMCDPVPIRRSNIKELRPIMASLIRRTNPKPPASSPK